MTQTFSKPFLFSDPNKQRKPRLKSQLDYNFTQQGRVHFKYQSQTGIQWHCEFSLKFDSVYLISSSHISIPKTNEMWRVVREIYSKTFGSTEWICVYL